jgi:serine kinase of HPr protein (carbohydrate metabolism regulator)
MTLKLPEVIKKLGLKVRSAQGVLDRTISGGYVSDLLSDVMGHSQKDNIWVTLQVHPNIVAVAVLKELAGIIVVNGREPAPETIAQAEKQQVPILVSELSAFELVGRLYGLGIQGT